MRVGRTQIIHFILFFVRHMLGNVNKYHSRYIVLGGCNTDIRGTLSGYRQTLQVLEEQQCERA